MSETPHGMDTVNETISVKGLTFSSQLGIGSAKWLEKKTGKGIMAAVQGLVPEAGTDLEISKLSLLLTALYLQAHPKTDPQEAEAAVDTLSFPEMMEVMARMSPLDFEPKNPQKVEPTEAPSTGQPSSTT